MATSRSSTRVEQLVADHDARRRRRSASPTVGRAGAVVDDRERRERPPRLAATRHERSARARGRPRARRAWPRRARHRRRRRDDGRRRVADTARELIDASRDPGARARSARPPAADGRARGHASPTTRPAGRVDDVEPRAEDDRAREPDPVLASGGGPRRCQRRGRGRCAARSGSGRSARARPRAAPAPPCGRRPARTGQRGWKRQPGGDAAWRRPARPLSMMRRRWRSRDRVGDGTADSRAIVYGCSGRSKNDRDVGQLDDLAQVHRRHAIGELLHDAHVVGDDEVRQALGARAGARAARGSGRGSRRRAPTPARRRPPARGRATTARAMPTRWR